MTSTTNGTQKRYDRQIRLWGAHGQERLEASKICVLGAGPMCTEALKNLVLGGIASFTIVDSRKVSEEDLRNNFFFQPSSLGLGRAQAACTLLRDLNDQVKGSFSDANVTEMLERSPDAFKEYNLVIAEQMQNKLIEKLDSKCRQIGAYLIVLRSQGPFASMQISGPELCVIETKPDTTPSDLRLSTAWPDLLSLANEVDLDSCDDIVHKHTPWAVLLLKAIAAWRGDHTGPPSSSAERRAFKEILQGWRRTIDGVPVEELNFDEAVRHAHTAFTESKVPGHVKQLMEDEKCTHPSASSSDFWIALAALKRFVESEGEGSLPMEGTVPDMTATTELYLQLQRVYRARADAHIDAVQSHCKALLKSIGKPEYCIPLDYIKLLCRNARHVRVVRPATAVRKPSEMNSECLRKSFESEEQMHEAMILLAIMAADTFYEQHQRAPGETATPDDASWEQDIPIMQQIISQLASELHLPASVVKQDLLLEFCRAAGPPMHTVSAIMGGIAAQEGLKVLLQQFVPLDGVFVYNGIHAASAVLPL